MRRPAPAVPPPPLVLAGEGASGSQEGTGWRFTVAEGPPPPGASGLPLPGDTRWPLIVRIRRPGDRVRGRAGSRKLQDLLVDRRVPAERRDAVPVVTDAEGRLLWVPGVWSTPPDEAPARLFLWASPPDASMPAPHAL